MTAQDAPQCLTTLPSQTHASSGHGRVITAQNALSMHLVSQDRNNASSTRLMHRSKHRAQRVSCLHEARSVMHLLSQDSIDASLHLFHAQKQA